MGLFTKLFNKNADPYVLPGRWYRVKIENGNIVSHDLPNCTVSLTPQASNTMLDIVSNDNRILPLIANIVLDRAALVGTLTSGSSIVGLTNFSFYYNINGVRISLGTTTILNQSSGYVYVYAIKR